MNKEIDSAETQELTPKVPTNSSEEETAYLLRSPENAKRLLRSIQQLNAGKGIVRTLIEPE